MQEFHCKIYQDYKISIPVKVRKLLAISPQDEIILRVNDRNEVIFATAKQELADIQKEMKAIFGNKSIVSDFLNTKKRDYDD